MMFSLVTIAVTYITWDWMAVPAGVFTLILFRAKFTFTTVYILFSMASMLWWASPVWYSLPLIMVAILTSVLRIHVVRMCIGWRGRVRRWWLLPWSSTARSRPRCASTASRIRFTAGKSPFVRAGNVFGMLRFGFGTEIFCQTIRTCFIQMDAIARVVSVIDGTVF